MNEDVAIVVLFTVAVAVVGVLYYQQEAEKNTVTNLQIQAATTAKHDNDVFWTDIGKDVGGVVGAAGAIFGA